MTQKSFVISIVIIVVSASLLTYAYCTAFVVSPLPPNEVHAQQDVGSLFSGSEGEVQLGPDVGGSSEQCPPNQHSVGSTNQCEWDNCGSATPPMYRNTQTGRCVSDCSEVGQSWVKQGNICILGSVSNGTSPQSSPSGSSISNQGGGTGNTTVPTEAKVELPSDNTSSRLSNLSSPPSTITQTLVGEPSLPYSCFSNTFTCYCDGTEGCKQLTSSNECKAEVRNVEGRPGLGQCDWNAGS